MQQRRPRLGDILDDYCPRERRVTNHAVVAMIEDEVKQTRCTTCDAEHEYKHAKVPAARRKKTAAPAAGALVDASPAEPALLVDDEDEALVEETLGDGPSEETSVEASADLEDAETETADDRHDEWPVHRPLIRATLPRPEGQQPERKAPDFTIRQSGGRFDQQRNGNQPRGNKPARHGHPQGHGGQSSGQPRFGDSRQGSGHTRHGGGQNPGNQRHGNRPGPSGQRSRPGHGGGSGGQRPGQGRGPKRGR